MGWDSKTVKEVRIEFVTEASAPGANKSALCRKYGISRPTGDKWIKRYLDGQSMDDLSRRPFHCPNKIPEETEAQIITQRLSEPAIGAAKIKVMLENNGYAAPAVSTINKVLQRNGLITREASLAAKPYTRFEKEEPNEMWQADFKGDFCLQDGNRCFPLSVIDDCSRKCLNADAQTNMQLLPTKESFIKTFREFGLPRILLCDNGNPWGAAQSTGITKFDVWMMDLGVLPIHIRAKHPQTQGKVERFNGSYKRERLKFYTPLDMADAQRTRDEYKNFYNSKRPHCALNMDCPDAHYTPSSRTYPEEVKAWDYESGGELRSIKSSGYIAFRGQGYFLSEALGSRQVMIYPRKDDPGKVTVTYRQFHVATIDTVTDTVIARRIYLRHGDPRSSK